MPNQFSIRRATGYRLVDFRFESSVRSRTCGCHRAIKAGTNHLVVHIAGGFPMPVCQSCCNKMANFLVRGQNAKKKNKKG